MNLYLTLKNKSTHNQLTRKSWVHTQYSVPSTDALMLKHQAISIHSADWIFIVLDQLDTEITHLYGNNTRKWNFIWKKKDSVI